MNPGPDAAQWYANSVAICAATISIFGVVVNAVIAYLAVDQFKAAQASATAARDSATQAQKSVEQAQRALEVANRAWVHVSEIIPHMSEAAEVSANKCIVFRPDVVLKNYGPTPATTLMAETRLGLLSDFPTNEEIQFQLSDKNGVSVVSPGNVFWVPSAFINFSFDRWHLVTSGKKKLVLFGRATYTDIFDKPHKSTWLYWFDSENAGGFVAGPCHNYVT